MPDIYSVGLGKVLGHEGSPVQVDVQQAIKSRHNALHYKDVVSIRNAVSKSYLGLFYQDDVYKVAFKRCQVGRNERFLLLNPYDLNSSSAIASGGCVVLKSLAYSVSNLDLYLCTDQASREIGVDAQLLQLPALELSPHLALSGDSPRSTVESRYLFSFVEHMAPFVPNPPLSLHKTTKKRTPAQFEWAFGQDPWLQEQRLLSSLYFNLLGFDSALIRFNTVLNAFELSPYCEHAFDGSLCSLTAKFLPLLDVLKRLDGFVESERRANGILRNALASHVQAIVRQFYSFVCKVFRQGHKVANLQNVYFLLQQSATVLKEIDSSIVPGVLGMQRGNVIGVLLALREKRKANHPHIDSMYAYLVQRLFGQVYLKRMLHTWLVEGKLEHDYFQEFAVCSSQEPPSPDSLVWCWWDQRFILRDENEGAPLFSEQVRHHILAIGKCANTLVNDFGEKLDVEGAIGSEASKRLAAHDVSRAELERLIPDLHRASAAQVWRLFNERLCIVQHLLLLKNVLLFGNGSWFLAFVETATSQLTSKASGVSVQRLNGLLRVAIAPLIAQCLSTNSHLTIECALDQCTLADRLDAVHLGSSTSSAQEDAIGVDLIVLSAKASAPLNAVLSKDAMFKYQLLFRHLFKAKWVLRRIGLVWTLLNRASATHVDLACCLNQKIGHFVKNYSYFLFYEVVEPQFAQFMSSLREESGVGGIDKANALHHGFLDSCLKESLLTNQQLLKYVNNIYILATTYSNYATINAERDSIDEGVLREMLSMFDITISKFIHALQTEAVYGEYQSHIANLLTRLNFNNYYRIE